MIAYIFIKVFKVKDKKIKQNAFYKPLKALLFILGIYIGLKLLVLPENVYAFIDKMFKICHNFCITSLCASCCITSMEGY